MKIKEKRIKFSIFKSINEVQELMSDELPDEEFVYKFISNGKFSSISFVMYLAEKAVINNFYASTLRVGRKELKMLDTLKIEGRLNNCFFVVGTLMKEAIDTSIKYKYYDDFEMICKKNDWSFTCINNHSKVLLFDTDKGKFVIETSSNLNENPKIEQFSICRSDELFEHYKNWFKVVLND